MCEGKLQKRKPFYLSPLSKALTCDLNPFKHLNPFSGLNVELDPVRQLANEKYKMWANCDSERGNSQISFTI